MYVFLGILVNKMIKWKTKERVVYLYEAKNGSTMVEHWLGTHPQHESCPLRSITVVPDT